MELSERGSPFHYPALVVWRTWSRADPLVLAIVFWSVVGWLWWNRHSRRRIPGPTAWPVIGCTIELVRNWDRLHDWLHGYYSNEVHTCQATFAYPLAPGIYTVDPANVEYILKTNFANYPKGASNCTPMQDLFGMGIFTTDGEQWKEQRRTASFEFSTTSLRNFSTVVFREYACELVSVLSHFAATREACDLQNLCMRMTLDSTCRIGFGVKLDCLSQELRSVRFAECFDVVNYVSFYRFCDPLWKMKRWLNVGRERKLKECLKGLDDFTFGVIEQRRVDMAAGTGTRIHQSDLLSRFIDLCGHDGEESKTGFTNRALRDMILNFIIAGRDTTAVTLSWFFYMMTLHPKVVKKIVDELASVVHIQKHGELPTPEAIVEMGDMLTYETLGKLHYLHATLTETLRLYPAVPIDAKEAASDDVLPDGTAVKRGSVIGYVLYAMGRMAFLWGDDAMEFRPSGG